MSVFIDSSFFIAYHNLKDKNHETALNLAGRIFSGEFGAVFTSDYVFDETITFTFVKLNARHARTLGEYILNSEIEMLFADKQAFDSAWKIFNEKASISFTDASIVALMKTKNIKFLASFDSDFNQFKKEMKLLN